MRSPTVAKMQQTDMVRPIIYFFAHDIVRRTPKKKTEMEIKIGNVTAALFACMHTHMHAHTHARAYKQFLTS